MNGDALLAIDPRAVVGNHHKDGVGPEGLLFRGFEEAAQREVGILYRILAKPLIGVFGDFALRIGVGLVIGDGENRAAERLAGLRQFAELLHRAQHQVLIADAPDRREARMLEVLLLDEAVVAVADCEGAHPVEDAAPTVEEDCRVPVAFQHAGDGLDIVRAVPFHDGLARQRREGGQHALEPPHGAVAGGKQVGEEHALLRGQLVHLRRERVLAPQAAPEFRAQAFLEDDHDVKAGAVWVAPHPPADGLAILGKLGVRFGEQPARAPVSFIPRHGLVERSVIEVVSPDRGE